jgi:hypothetical protein
MIINEKLVYQLDGICIPEEYLSASEVRRILGTNPYTIDDDGAISFEGTLFLKILEVWNNDSLPDSVSTVPQPTPNYSLVALISEFCRILSSSSTYSRRIPSLRLCLRFLCFLLLKVPLFVDISECPCTSLHRSSNVLTVGASLFPLCNVLPFFIIALELLTRVLAISLTLFF